MSAGPISWHTLRVYLVASWTVLGVSATAAAQIDEPIGRFVTDLRGSVASFGQNADLAFSRGFDPSLTPSTGLGFQAGAHLYLYRWRTITFGVGANFHTSVGNRPAREDDLDPNGPTLRKKFTSFSPQLSFNFGGRDGWSYLSGGIGTSRLSLFPLSEGEPPPRSADTLNYGGGARWFVKDHLALSLDLRFYAISPLEPTDTEPGSPRMTIMVLNIGASFK